MHLARRGQRPRLQRSGNANFLITFCAHAKVIRKSGTMFGRIRSGTASLSQQTIGPYSGEIETLMLWALTAAAYFVIPTRESRARCAYKR